MKNFLILSFLWGLLFYVRVSSGQQQAVADAVASASANSFGNYGNYAGQGIGPNGVPPFQNGGGPGYNPYNGGYNNANAESSAYSFANTGGGQWGPGGLGGAQNQWLPGGGQNNGALNLNNGGNWVGGGPYPGSRSDAAAGAIANAGNSGGNPWTGVGPNQGSGSYATAEAIANDGSSGGNGPRKIKVKRPRKGKGGPNGGNGDAAAYAAAASDAQAQSGGPGNGNAVAYSESDAQAQSGGPGNGNAVAYSESDAQAQSGGPGGNSKAAADSVSIAQTYSDDGAPWPPGGSGPNQYGGNNNNQWSPGIPWTYGGPKNGNGPKNGGPPRGGNNPNNGGPPGGGNNPNNGGNGNAAAVAYSESNAQAQNGGPGGNSKAVADSVAIAKTYSDDGAPWSPGGSGPNQYGGNNNNQWSPGIPWTYGGPKNGNGPKNGGPPGGGNNPNYGGPPGGGNNPNNGGPPGGGNNPNYGGPPGVGNNPNYGGPPGGGNNPNYGGPPGGGNNPNYGVIPWTPGSPNNGNGPNYGPNNGGPPGGGNNPNDGGQQQVVADTVAIASADSDGGYENDYYGNDYYGNYGKKPVQGIDPNGGSPGPFKWPGNLGGGGDILSGVFPGLGDSPGNPLDLGPLANYLQFFNIGDGGPDFLNKFSSILDACNSGNYDDAVSLLDKFWGGSGNLIDLWSKLQDKIPPKDQWTDVSAWFDKWGIDPTLYYKLQNIDWSKVTQGYKDLPGKAMSYLLKYLAFKQILDIKQFQDGLINGYLCGIKFGPTGQWSGIPGNYWQTILNYCTNVDSTPQLTDPMLDMTADMTKWACDTFGMTPADLTKLMSSWTSVSPPAAPDPLAYS